MPKRVDVEAVFRAAVTVLADRGYAGATTSEIAARAGVNEVTLYRRYGTKAALIEAALAHCLADAPFARLGATDDLRADLEAIVDAYAATNAAYGGAVMTLLVEMPRHEELRHAVAALMTNLRGAAAVVAAHQAAGRLPPGDPLALVALLVAPLLAAGVWARSGAGGVPTSFGARDVVERFLHGNG